MTEPLILLTNDDGIHAEGLRYLKSAAEKLGEVVVVAPESEQSAVGHSITLYNPIKVHEVVKDGTLFGYGVSGTPADAVKLAIHSLLPRRPDLVLSGINNGANLGINVLYSGTVSAATEAAMLGVQSMAVSIAQKKYPPFPWAVPHIRKIAGWVIKNGLPQGVALNVNVPAMPPDKISGLVVATQGLVSHREFFEQREDPRGDRYYWLSGEATAEDTSTGSDVAMLKLGYVTVTPLFYDLTAHRYTEELAWSLKKL